MPNLRKIIFCAFLFIALLKSSPDCLALSSLNSEDTSRQRSVLVSSDVSAPDLDFVIREERDKNRDVLISWEEAEFSANFVVRPEARGKGSALVNKPAALDLEILNIIYEAGISTVEDYSAWLKENIQYREEDADIWARPEDTLDNRYGDCEDFAFLNAEVMRIFGYEPKVLGLVGGFIAENHAVCVFKKDDRFFWFDNTTLKEAPVSSLPELNDYFFKNYLCAYIMEIRFDQAKPSLAAQALEANNSKIK